MTSTNLLEKKYDAPSLDSPWQDDIVSLRRDFHANPELGFEEVRTAQIIAERLRARGLRLKFQRWCAIIKFAHFL